jgi:hypothetical protein
MPEGTIKAMENVDADDVGGEEEILQPRGQHLLVDIKNVDPAFLNSDETFYEVSHLVAD